MNRVINAANMLLNCVLLSFIIAWNYSLCNLLFGFIYAVTYFEDVMIHWAIYMWYMRLYGVCFPAFVAVTILKIILYILCDNVQIRLAIVY